MTNPNMLMPTGDLQPGQHQEAAAAVVHLASQSNDADTVQRPPVDVEFAKHPTSWRAMEGPHPTWLGFGKDGQTK